MNTHEICLPRKLTNQLLHLAQLSSDAEVCGLVGADRHGLPCSCYPVDNAAANPQNRFSLEPGQQIAAMKHMRENGQTLFAIYHSHPTAPATPSATDIEQASYPDALHLIISLNTKGVLEMRAFKIAGNQVEEFPLRLIEQA
ncbi:Mov34/MPN/PAD-1 family protein [Methylomonas methanica]|uniref:Mov34/MPN/PAD-1 family protein n=1 Tax=Methylomonas methanica (strain DSM 25384 / MC09) TaxID=857087 RepID=F9ZXP0_METMM|nr:M67 family metallopeptidase [Methylomonas methanica]AEG02195.1 Mov34/MPN/PAD-1 family protein [Methylomonas methanica MC09]